jgi:anti-sigma28 factor (negative regulator of flagellin synthesis)
VSEESGPAEEFAEIFLAAATAVGQNGARASTAAGESPESKEDRVVELRRRYRDGSYQVEPSALAAKIVDDHLR